MKLKGRRQSKNIDDVSGPHSSKKYQKANEHGRLQDKVMHGTSVTENKSLKKIPTTQNTKNSNMRVNNVRQKYPDLLGSLVKNVPLNAKPTKFKPRSGTTSQTTKKKKK